MMTGLVCCEILNNHDKYLFKTVAVFHFIINHLGAKMALRNIKIACEIVQNCNKLLASKSDVVSTFSNTSALEAYTNRSSSKAEIPRLSNDTTVAPLASPLSCSEVLDTTIKDLAQPVLPEKVDIKFKNNYYLWKTAGLCKRLGKTADLLEIVPKNIASSLGREVQSTCNVITRNHSTIPTFCFTRTYSKGCGKRSQEPDPKCPRKKVCKKERECPDIRLANCERAPKSDCTRYYQEVCCKKKMAPYPSYSEACHEVLEDSPSECFQCPWQKCGGVDAIRVPKSTRKKFHTSARQAVTAVSECHFGPFQEPCKRPPKRCPPKEKPKCPPPKKEKKKCDWTTSYGFWMGKDNILPTSSWYTVSLQPEVEADGCCKKFPYDKRQVDYEHLKKRKCHREGCIKKKKPSIIEDCPQEPCKHEKLSLRPTEVLGLELKDDCGSGEKRCPPDCVPPDTKGPCNTDLDINCPKIDRDINVFRMDHLMIKEHDKGHPPPCPHKKHPSKQCPESMKKKYKINRDLDRPYYRKQPPPYSPNSDDV